MPAATKSVPPTAVMYGEDAGKSGWYLAPMPSRPSTPWSPEAKRTEIPMAPNFINAMLASSMYSSEVCCASSLPYETEWMRGGDAILLIWVAHFKREYCELKMSVSGMAPESDPAYSISRRASPQSSVPSSGMAHSSPEAPPTFFTLRSTPQAEEKLAISNRSYWTPWNSATAMLPLAEAGAAPSLYAFVSTAGVTNVSPHLSLHEAGKLLTPSLLFVEGVMLAMRGRRSSGKEMRSPTIDTYCAISCGSE
mmetsp:Transcript_65419/g.108741  ORF Transcript_65419/g.108741 Transcript_65419/m.108741 type:complete len:251 (-) Transcript_65419:592-1344(-)